MVVAFAAMLLWAGVAAGGERPSAVRLLRTPDGGRCSMVVVSRHRALTAAHCGVGRKVGPDLAELRGSWPPPYAPITAPRPGAVLLEGWGCDASYVWFVEHPKRSVRLAVLLERLPWPGQELGLYGRVCNGDSGGAVWADGGGLVGIIVSRSTRNPSLAFATIPR